MLKKTFGQDGKRSKWLLYTCKGNVRWERVQSKIVKKDKEDIDDLQN